MRVARRVATRVARRVGGVPSYIRGASTDYSKRLAVIIGLGESMIVGQASNSTGMPATYPPSTGLWKFTDSGVMTAMVEPNDDPGSRAIFTANADPPGSYGHGYASVVAWRIQKLLSTGYEVLYVPCGLSGTTSWDWSTKSKLLAHAIDKGRAALALPNAELALILVDQGVNDCGATSDPDGLTWTKRWTAALTKARGAWGAKSSVRNVFRRLPATATAGYDATKWANLRTEQAAYASSLNAIVDGYDGGFIGGGPHYTATGNERMSRRMYETAKSLLPMATPTLTGRRGWKTWPASTTVFGTSTTEGTFGAAGGGAILALVRIDSIPVGVQRIVVRVNGNNGYDLRVNGSAIQLIAGNGTTSATAPGRTIVAGDVGKIHLLCLTWNGTAVFHYFDRAQVGASTALAGFSPATGKSAVVMSTDAGASANVSMTFLDWCARDSFLSLADYQTICDSTKTAGYLTPGAISMDHTYQFPLESSAPDYVRDSVGAADLEFLQGDERNVTHETIDLTTATWGW